MKCPICLSELIVTGQARLETISEHVDEVRPSLKDKYECPTQSCPAFGRVMWNEDGELYIIKRDDISKNLKFIDNNDAPFGSFQRKCNVEIYKDDENYDLFTIGKWRFRIKFKYESDEDGRILKRHRKLETWRKIQEGTGWVLHMWGIWMLVFVVRQFHEHWKIHKKNNNEFSRKQLLEHLKFEEKFPRSEWWRTVSAWYMRFMLTHFSDLLPKNIKQKKKICKMCGKPIRKPCWDFKYEKEPPEDCPFYLEHRML